MAQFRGVIFGARGEASRLGHKSSGLRVIAQAWGGQVSVHLHYSEEAQCDMAVVTMGPHGGGSHVTLYSGPVSGWQSNGRTEA